MRDSYTTLPKPPLAKKPMTIADENHSTSTNAQEQLLLMADEGISKIKQELLRKRPPPMCRVEERPSAKQQHVKSNFNLSFNNSFNTSIANSGQKATVALRAES
jgi:hypothetical protein